MKNLLLFLPLLVFASCATITRGVHEKLSVVSDPTGADVKLSTGEHGVTPAKFVKPRRTESFTVTVSKTGYVPQTVKVESKIGGTGGAAVAGNAILGGVIGIGVDAGTGAYNSLYPNPVSVHLVPTAKTTTTKTTKKTASSTTNEKPKAKTKATASPAPKPEEPPKVEATPPPVNAATPEPTATPYVPPTLESSPAP